MSSSVDICNMALSRLGCSRITSLSDGTIESNECAAIYPNIVKYVQAKGPWTSNLIRANLAQSATPPVYGFAYAYQLPTDPLCLRVLRINEEQLGINEYHIEDGLLLIDQATVAISYIGLLTDPNSFGPYLEESIIDHLVAQMAYKFTGQLQAQQTYMKYASDNLTTLLNIDGIQGSNEFLPSDTFLDVRLGGGSFISPSE